MIAARREKYQCAPGGSIPLRSTRIASAKAARSRRRPSPPPAPVARHEPAKRDQRERRRPATAIASTAARAKQAQPEQPDPPRDQVERGRHDQHRHCPAQPAAGDREGRAKVSASARRNQPFGPDPAFHQPLGGQFLDQWQQIAADPVAARPARGEQQALLELAIAPPSARNGPALAREARAMPDARPGPRGGAGSTAGPSRRSSPRSRRPARPRPAPAPPSELSASIRSTRLMLVVGDGQHHRLVVIGDPREVAHVGRNPSAISRTSLPASNRLAASSPSPTATRRCPRRAAARTPR